MYNWFFLNSYSVGSRFCKTELDTHEQQNQNIHRNDIISYKQKCNLIANRYT